MREVIGQHLALLPEAAEEVLAVAAVIGREFDVGLLSEASEVGEEIVLDVLEATEDARLITSTPGRLDRYAFSHALVRSTLYENLATARRLRLHRRVGRALEARPDAAARVAELARHFGEASGLGEVQRAVTYARRAGDGALADLAFEEAAAHYERGLAAITSDGPADPVTSCELKIALGDGLKRAGLSTGFGDEWLRLGGVKFVADGSASGRTMYMSTPYLDRPGDHGVLTMTATEIRDAVEDAHRHHFQIGIHANGDRTIEYVLDAYERAQKLWPRPDPRHGGGSCFPVLAPGSCSLARASSSWRRSAHSGEDRITRSPTSSATGRTTTNGSRSNSC